MLYFDCRLAVFHGTRLDPVKTIGIRTCGIVACTNESVPTCGARSSALIPVTFKSISIRGQFYTAPEILDLPVTLQTDLTPLNNYIFCSEPHNDENKVKINMATVTEASAILSFGFYGRVYLNDGKELGHLEVDYGSESSTTFIAVALVIVLLLVAAIVGFVLYKRRRIYSAVSK